MARPKDGSKLFPTPEEWARFEGGIQKNAGPKGTCWIMDAPMRGRYPFLLFRGEWMMAARFAYRASDKPEIPPEKPMLGRWCGQKKCVNPDHQVPMDDWRNSERTVDNPISANLRKEVCPKCHGPYEVVEGGKRRCRECRAASQRECAERHKVPCIGCGQPSIYGECRSCKNTRLFSASRANKAARKAIRAARVTLRKALQQFCEKHNVAKKQNTKGRWVCPECSRDTRKRVRSFGPDRYKALRAAGKCVACHHPSETYRCERCHARHMASTHARREKEKAQRLMAKATLPSSDESSPSA